MPEANIKVAHDKSLVIRGECTVTFEAVLENNYPEPPRVLPNIRNAKHSYFSHTRCGSNLPFGKAFCPGIVGDDGN